MTVAEEDGVETRGAYYDSAGALRDMVQNHMFQLLTLVAMEPPISFRAEDVRDEKVKVLHAITPLDRRRRRARSVVRAQYHGLPRGTERLADVAHRDVRRAASCSSTTGGGPACRSTCGPASGCARRLTEIAVQFKRAPFTLFRETPVACTNPNVLTLRIQPEEGDLPVASTRRCPARSNGSRR